MPSLFRTSEIMAHQNNLLLVTLRSVCLFAMFPSLCSSNRPPSRLFSAFFRLTCFEHVMEVFRFRNRLAKLRATLLFLFYKRFPYIFHCSATNFLTSAPARILSSRSSSSSFFTFYPLDMAVKAPPTSEEL